MRVRLSFSFRIRISSPCLRYGCCMAFKKSNSRPSRAEVHWEETIDLAYSQQSSDGHINGEHHDGEHHDE
jgi:hypothetical protein